jgi:SPASM domain peptide maturase of grasp-with-spasm system
MKSKIWFKFFQNCQLILGINTSLIYDLERSTYYQIPSTFAKILYDLKNQDIETYIKEQKLDKNEIYNFINQFIKEELGFLTKTPKQFPDLNLDWDSPHKISNAVIEISNKSKFSISSIINQLTNLKCQAVQFRIINKTSINELNALLGKLSKSTIRCVEIFFPFNEKIKDTELTELLTSFPHIRLVYIYNSTKNYTRECSDSFLNKKIIYSENLKESLSKEKITNDTFIYNIPSFCEANNYNLGLNRKICICANGDIKNYLSHNNIFGNVNSDKLFTVINRDSFKEKWFITNDKIEKCKDCQFRYACLSNSDIIKKKNKFYKTLDCGYNPYENKWTETNSVE